jgi:L-iditol 2-dehydrogenase
VGRVVNVGEENLAEVIVKETGGRGADVIIVAAPAHVAQEQALDLAAIGGRINFFGGLPKDRPTITFNSNTVHYKELTVTGTTACSTLDCWRAAELVNSGRIDLSGVISARYPLSQAREAFEAAEGRQALKIVMEP